MKLYDCHVAPNPRRARMFIAEKNIEVEKIEVDILGGENLHDKFLTINPRGLLPVLELDDGTRIDEAMAICRYFEEVQPDPLLLGRDAKEKAVITCRQRKMEFDGMIGCSEVFRNTHEQFTKRSIPGGGRDNIPAIPALVKRGKQTLDRFFYWLETYLEEGPYLAGEHFSMVDITAVCAVDFAGWTDITIPEENTRSLNWYKEVSSRPSAKA
ncbi:MAG: glutathione S-transferase family protein [Thiotrichales bacterium]|nr:glutathione S-transferase family protein [Thiotrichales bacterium]